MIAQKAAQTCTPDELEARIGQELGVSSWRTVGQSDLDAFAEVTDDHQFIHVDPERAAVEAPFGGTIAHGFLTLSLLSAFGREVLPAIAGRRMGVNYGFDRVRFVSPVRSGARVRGRFVLKGVARRSEAELLSQYGVTVEIESEAKPALVADWLTLAILEGGAGGISQPLLPPTAATGARSRPPG